MNLPNLKIIVAHPEPDIRDLVCETLADRHRILDCCDTIVRLKQLALQHDVDMVVLGVGFKDGDGIDTMIELAEVGPVASVVVTPKRSIELVQKAMQDHVMAYLIEPITREDLEAAMLVAYDRGRQIEQLNDRVEELETRLETRKLVERARGILMAAEELTEDEAYQQLRSRSQNERQSMAAISRRVIEDANQASG
jgi:response regulator NasT